MVTFRLYEVEWLRWNHLTPREKVCLPSSVVKNLPANAGDMSSIPGLERSPGEGNGNPLQYCCPGNPMDRGAWQSTVLEVPRVQHDLVTKPPPLPHVSQRYIEPKDRIKIY